MHAGPFVGDVMAVLVQSLRKVLTAGLKRLAKIAKSVTMAIDNLP